MKVGVKIENLQTIQNYARERDVTTSYIYKLIKDGRMASYAIDGVQFIQTDIYPSIPVANRRK